MPTLTFQPATYNVRWDGVSEANVSLQLACQDTAASFVSLAHRVMTSSGSYSPLNTANDSVLTWKRGERFFTIVDQGTIEPITKNTVAFGNFSLPVTVSDSVATIQFSGIANTADGQAYSWWLEATKGGVKKVWVAGRIDVDAQNPYQPNTPSNTFVSGVTAYGCF